MHDHRTDVDGCRRHAIIRRSDTVVTVAFPGPGIKPELAGEQVLNEIVDVILRDLPKLAPDDPVRPSLQRIAQGVRKYAGAPTNLRAVALRARAAAAGASTPEEQS